MQLLFVVGRREELAALARDHIENGFSIPHEAQGQKEGVGVDANHEREERVSLEE